MHHRERLFIYAALLVLLGLIVAGQVDDGPARALAAAPTPDELGPADAIRLGGEGGSELVLRSAGKRLAWGETEHQRAYSIGFVHIGDVLRKLVAADVFLEERQALADELREQEEEFLDQRRQFEQRYADVSPDDPRAEEARRDYTALQQAFEQFRTEANRRIARLAAEQLERAYRELVAAANVVADRQDIDIIYRFIPTDDPFEVENPDQAMLAIRLRSVLRYPQGTDITDDVLEELSLEVD